VERLWSPWRYSYVTSGTGEGVDSSACVFCAILQDPSHDEGNFVLHRAAHCFVVLNIYPYISGHLLVVLNQHIGDLALTPKEASNELMDLTKRCQTALSEAYQPAGYNIGLNLGRAAGAGIVDHLHIHVMPRWAGDTNFMSTVAETRVIPEDLAATYGRLKGHFQMDTATGD
jgi:ATP adenylyltransferase